MTERPELRKRSANFVALSPVSFLARAAECFGDRIAIVHGTQRYTYRQFYARARQLAHALTKAGIERGDTVAILAANAPAMLEAHYAAPMIGAVLNPINIRLDAPLVSFCLEHGEAKLLLADREFHATIAPALEKRGAKRPIVIDIADPETAGAPSFGSVEYEDFIAAGDPTFAYAGPADEWDSICLLYTSGTTGNPKGAVYSHRGAYLGALANALTFKLDHESRYLWTLPMFHCSGWTFTWAVTATGGTHVCLRKVEPRRIFDSIAEHRVTHMCGAPIVLNMLVHAPADAKRRPAAAHQGGDRRRRPARHRYRAHGGDGLRGAAPLRHHRELRPLDLLRADVGMAGPAGRRALRTDGAPGHPQPAHRADDGGGPQHAGAYAQGRSHHRRADADRQYPDEGLPQERSGNRGGLRRRLLPLRRSRRLAWRWQHGGQGPLQGHHHFRAARTSPPSRSRRCSIATRR